MSYGASICRSSYDSGIGQDVAFPLDGSGGTSLHATPTTGSSGPEIVMTGVPAITEEHCRDASVVVTSPPHTPQVGS